MPDLSFADTLRRQGLDPAALADDPAGLAALFAAYAGGDDDAALLAALRAQFGFVDLGVRAEIGHETGFDVVYHGAGDWVLGYEVLAPPDDTDPPPERIAALIALATAEDALSAGILTRTRRGTMEWPADEGEPWVVPLRPIAHEALRVGLPRR